MACFRDFNDSIVFQLLCNFGADTEDIARILQGKKHIL